MNRRAIRATAGDFGECRVAGCDYGTSTLHGLEDWQTESFIERGIHKGERAGEQARQFRIGNLAQVLHTF